MSSHPVKKRDPYVTESRLEAILEEKFQHFQQYFHEFSLEIINGIQTMFDEQDRKYEKKFKQITNRLENHDDKFVTLNNKIDRTYELCVSMLSEIKSMREEETILAYRQAKHSDRLEDHAIRISRLEATKV